MTNLLLLRGYPGSGKTTVARDWLAAWRPDERPRARSNRDDLRMLHFGTHGERGHLSFAQEQHLTDIQHDSVRKLLKRGYDVIVDDLNLKRKYAVEWAALALEQGSGFTTVDIDTDVDTCIKRDFARRLRGERGVGEEGIRKVASRFPLGRWPDREGILKSALDLNSVKSGDWRVYDNPVADEYGPLKRVIIVDIDGTVALKDRTDGARGWHEYHRVYEDLPNYPVIEMVNALRSNQHAGIIFLSGRKDTCREQTRRWLADYVGLWTRRVPLHMRAADDNRSDDIVKHELFDEHIRGRYHVVGVFDDRDRVVDMWRAIGLQVYQVAPGNF